MAKGRVGRYTDEFKRMCVERMKQHDDVGALARELQIHRRMLYRWRDRLEPVAQGKSAPRKTRGDRYEQFVVRRAYAMPFNTASASPQFVFRHEAGQVGRSGVLILLRDGMEVVAGRGARR